MVMKQSKQARKGRFRKKMLDKENIWNIPNSLTLLRIFCTFACVYLIFGNFPIISVAIIFTIGMITDFLDGQIARRYNMTTEFGRKFDMIADRFLMIFVVFAIIIKLSISGYLERGHMLQLFVILSREVFAFPFALILLISGKRIPDARFIGKLTTFMQGVAFPIVLLSIFYPFFSFSGYFAFVTCIIGTISAFYFMNDVWNSESHT